MFQGEELTEHTEDIKASVFYVTKEQRTAIRNLAYSGYTFEAAVAKVLELPVERFKRHFILEFLDE
jgi:hypothetical protein